MLFRGEFSFLSNFSDVYSGIEYRGILFPTTENAYQAAKCRDKKDMLKFADLTPVEAKKLSHQIGKIIPKRENWNDIKVSVMTYLLEQKFQVPYFKSRLLNTGNLYICEDNYWHDNFWGVCSCPKCSNMDFPYSKNHLGEILMKIRSDMSESIDCGKGNENDQRKFPQTGYQSN